MNFLHRLYSRILKLMLIFPNACTASTWNAIFGNCFRYFAISSMLLYVTGLEQNLVNLAICIAATLLFLVIKLPLTTLFFNTFYTIRHNGFPSRYYKLTVLFGNVCFMGGIILSYTLNASVSALWIISIIIGALYCISVSYIFISTFFENRGSFLRLFLYLCTLEITPIMVLVQALS